MGLDSYLIKRKKQANPTLEEIWEFDDSQELMYWRKANAIHKYLCDNGEKLEEQITYRIDKDILHDLINRCKEAINVAEKEPGKVLAERYWDASKNEWIEKYEDGYVYTNVEELSEILPTQSGFFFGSTDYDEWYFRQLERTIEELEPQLDTIKPDEEVYYLASW